MKRLHIYRILVIILILLMFYQMILYNNKNCIVKINKEYKNVVFFGDSIIDYCDLSKYYKSKDVLINSGISGNRTQDLLNNMEKRVYQYKPNKVFLLIGINDILYRDDSSDVVNNIEKITSEIKEKFPNCKIYIESIYPINDNCPKKYPIKLSVKETNELVNEYNSKIKDLCQEKDYTYIDVHSKLIDDKEKFDSKYTNDGLHPNDNGYKVITKILKKYL